MEEYTYAPLPLDTPKDEDEDSQPLIPSVVQFTCAIYFALDNEAEMRVDVARLGAADSVASFDYFTEDGSARHGQNYFGVYGSLEFAQGETTQTIIIPLICRHSWSTALEFSVILGNVRGARKGPYLDRCRVKVFNLDCFPTNKLDYYYKSGRMDEISHAFLFAEYLKLCLRSREIRLKAIACLILDQFHSLYYFLTIYLQMYLVDVVLQPRVIRPEKHGERRLLFTCIGAVARSLFEVDSEIRPGMKEKTEERSTRSEHKEEGGKFHMVIDYLIIPNDPLHTAMVVAFLIVIPVTFLHMGDFSKCYISLQGSLRKMLQANLLRRFLNYDEETHETIKNGELSMVMSAEVVEVVDGGVMRVMRIIRIFGKLVLAMIFIMAEHKMAAVPMVIYPVVLSLFLLSREGLTVSVNTHKAHELSSVMHCVMDAITKYRLVADFFLRPVMVDTYEKRIDAYNFSESTALAVQTNNMYLVPWLTAIVIGLYMVTGSVIINSGGSLTLGAFIATINVFRELGVEIQEIYLQCLEIQRSYGSLSSVCKYMNASTDLLPQWRINRMRREVGLQQRQTQRRKNGVSSPSVDFPVDLVQVEAVDLKFRYSVDVPLIEAVSMRFDQGKLHAIVGPPHEGKATLLKLIGQVYLPKEHDGFVFIPPHLRVLHLSRDQLLLRGTLLQNLFMGSTESKVGGKARVRQICITLGFEKRLLQYIDDDCDVEATLHENQLSLTTWARLNLARAFVMNPEVLVAHKPCSGFNDTEIEQVMSLLRAHCDERGLVLSDKIRSYRRPRTAFISASAQTGLHKAHDIYTMSRARGLVHGMVHGGKFVHQLRLEDIAVPPEATVKTA